MVPIAVLASLAMACGEDAGRQRENERLAAKNEALEAEIVQVRDTVVRLEAEVQTLLAENVELKNQLESTSLELETARSRGGGLGERVVVVEDPSSGYEDGYADDMDRPLPINAIDEDTGLQVIEASARATERNNSWWRFGWAVTITNHSEERQDFSLQVQFMDQDGFVVDDDTHGGLTLQPLETRTFRDSDLVTARVAPRVTSVNPVIKN